MQNRLLALCFFLLTLVGVTRPQESAQAIAFRTLKRPGIIMGLLGCAARGYAWHQEKKDKAIKGGVNKIEDLLNPAKRNSPHNLRKIQHKVVAAVSRSMSKNLFTMAVHYEGMHQLVSRGILPKLSNTSAFRAYSLGLSSAGLALAMTVPCAIFGAASAIRKLPIPHDQATWNSEENQALIKSVAKICMPGESDFEIGKKIGPIKAILAWPVMMSGKLLRSGNLVPGAGLATRNGISIERASSASNFLMQAAKHATIACGVYLKLA